MGFFTSLRVIFSSDSSKKSSSRSEYEKDHHNSRRRSHKKKSRNQQSELNASEISVTSDPAHTTSTSETHSFHYIDGRKFADESTISYVLPYDEDENDRVHQQHWILRHALHCNFHAPVDKFLEDGITVLDSGCGPATWSFEMAESYPQSKFYGIDIVRSFPESIKPVNVEFAIGNIAEPLPFENEKFDYIHQRLLALGLSNTEWDKSLDNMYHALKPGGFIELAESDLKDFDNTGPLMNKMGETLGKLLEGRNMVPKISCELKERLAKAGFTNIIEVQKIIPLNHSGKVGQLIWDDYRHGITNIRHAMGSITPEWNDREAYKLHLEEAGQECIQMNTNCVWHVAYAQKPM